MCAQLLAADVSEGIHQEPDEQNKCKKERARLGVEPRPCGLPPCNGEWITIM